MRFKISPCVENFLYPLEMFLPLHICPLAFLVTMSNLELLLIFLVSMCIDIAGVYFDVGL